MGAAEGAGEHHDDYAGDEESGKHVIAVGHQNLLVTTVTLPDHPTLIADG
jgi:hypothetical protein